MLSEQLDIFRGSAPPAWARFSPCGRYRYELGRRALGGHGRMVMLLCNPSTAGRKDPAAEDNTSRRCKGFAVRERSDELVLINPFAFSATEPDKLAEAWLEGRDIVGPDNDRTIAEWAARADLLVIGCGAPPGRKAFKEAFRERIAELVRGPLAGRELLCLGLTDEGWPRHPRLLRNDAPLKPWEMPR